MNELFTILIGIFEAVALVVIVRLWIRPRHRLAPRILWSIILLVPLFGLLMYGFIVADLEKHPHEKCESQADSDAFYGGGGGGH